jgi:hypothetical protein
MAQQLQQTPKEDRSLGELFTDLANNTSLLVRQEVALATAEITQKAVSVGTNVGYLAAGGAVGYTALLVILAAVVIGLTKLLVRYAGVETLTAAFISSLAVGLIVGGVAAYLVTSALAALRKTDLMPNRTIESVKEDAEWIKQKVTD